MLAGIAAMRPRDEAEAMLIAQMVATHELAMTFARRLKRSGRLKGVGRLTGEDGQLVPYEAEQEAIHGNVSLRAQGKVLTAQARTLMGKGSCRSQVVRTGDEEER
jgi:hypothetical protein